MRISLRILLQLALLFVSRPAIVRGQPLPPDLYKSRAAKLAGERGQP